MPKFLPLARRTSHATRILASTRSVAALTAPPSRRYQDTPVTQRPKRTMPETDKATMRGARPKAAVRRGARNVPERAGDFDDISDLQEDGWPTRKTNL